MAPIHNLPHLASHILARVARRISSDWMDRYNHPIYLLETFVDRQSFRGTCYRAANWIYVGKTTGRTRNDRELIASPVLNCDETGLYIDGKRQWLHVAATDKLTAYFPHPKRGAEVTREMGILPNFQGTAVHDFWKPYYQYPCAHALCNAHLLRELTAIQEQYKQQWPQEMKDLLLGIKQTVEFLLIPSLFDYGDNSVRASDMVKGRTGT